MKRRDEQMAQQYQQQLTAAKEPSAAETQAEKDRKSYFDWRDKGDFTKPPPTLIGLSYGPSAERRRELEKSSVPTGIFGMGGAYANPTALALAQQNMADTNANADANAYQDAITGEDTYQRTGNSQGLMAQDFARKMGLLNTSSGMTQFQTGARIQTQPQSILPMLLSGLIGGASAFATGGLSAMVRPGAATSDARLKDDIRPLSDTIDRLKQIHGVSFSWNLRAAALGLTPGALDAGVLAQDVEAVFPELITVLDDGYKRVNYTALTALLLEAMKELERENVELRENSR